MTIANDDEYPALEAFEELDEEQMARLESEYDALMEEIEKDRNLSLDEQEDEKAYLYDHPELGI